MSVEKDIAKIEKLTEKRKSEKIISFMNSKEPEVAVAAYTALGKIGDEAATNALAGKLDNPDKVTRANAVKAFGSLKTEYAKSILQHQITKETDAEVKEVIRVALLEFTSRK